MENKRKRKGKKDMTVKERAQKDRMKRKTIAESVINLCDTCVLEFQICGGNPAFGSGLGNDNVIACDEYIKTGSLVIANRGKKSTVKAETLNTTDEEAKALRLIEDRAEEEYHERRSIEKQGGI